VTTARPLPISSARTMLLVENRELALATLRSTCSGDPRARSSTSSGSAIRDRSMNCPILRTAPGSPRTSTAARNNRIFWS
jgi:hypothetical protein